MYTNGSISVARNIFTSLLRHSKLLAMRKDSIQVFNNIFPSHLNFHLMKLLD